MSLTLVINTVLPVFLIIGLGFILGKKKRIDTQPIIDFIVYISGPALIITAFSQSNLTLDNFKIVLISAALILLLQGIIVTIILKINKSKKIGLYLPMLCGNTGYLGYPIALFAFGTIGLSNAIVYDMINSIFLFSIGIYIIHHRNDIKEMFKIPLLYAAIIGLAVNLLNISIPEMIFKPLEMLGLITIPTALIILGIKLTKLKISHVKTASLASIFRITVGFMLGVIITIILNIQGITRNVIILEAAMPSAVMSLILTHKYNRDPELVASIVLLSTIISIITIPLILIFVSTF